jgi:hypothetical protein
MEACLSAKVLAEKSAAARTLSGGASNASATLSARSSISQTPELKPSLA